MPPTDPSRVFTHWCCHYLGLTGVGGHIMSCYGSRHAPPRTHLTPPYTTHPTAFDRNTYTCFGQNLQFGLHTLLEAREQRSRARKQYPGIHLWLHRSLTASDGGVGQRVHPKESLIAQARGEERLRCLEARALGDGEDAAVG